MILGSIEQLAARLAVTQLSQDGVGSNPIAPIFGDAVIGEARSVAGQRVTYFVFLDYFWFESKRPHLNKPGIPIGSL